MYANDVRKDIRSVGIIMMELHLRRRLTSYERKEYENLSHFGLEKLRTVVDLKKYNPTLRLLIEACFDISVDIELKPIMKLGVKFFELKVPDWKVIRELQATLAMTVAEAKRMVDDAEARRQDKKDAEWTMTDEKRRISRQARRDIEKAEYVRVGIAKAQSRVDEQKQLLWFQLQPLHIQKRILKQRAVRKINMARTKERIKMLHMASFHCW